MSRPAFDFGKNWKEFSDHAFDAAHYDQAQAHFAELMESIPLAGKSFIDIGFGQGLSLLCAIGAGARVSGIDINPKCREVFLANAKKVGASVTGTQVDVGSILEPASLAKVRAWGPDGFDVAHSWGVLHHTGEMWKAMENAASLVRPGGYFVLAIYNRHITSPVWALIKRGYVSSPRIVQKLLNILFVPIIYMAKLLVTRRNPLKTKRGMDFYYDVVDWIGGYPYEYASREEIEHFVVKYGFTLTRFDAAAVPTGCNEFVFMRD